MLQAFKNWLIWRGLLVASAVGRRLPLPAARRAGKAVGRLAYRVVAKERRRALQHLALALPDLSPAEHQRIAREMFQHLGQSLFEIAWLPNLDAMNLEVHTRFEGLEGMRMAAESGRGVILFTGHCGNWEWMGAAMALAGLPTKTVARDIYDPRLNEFIVGFRRHFGVESIGRGSTTSARDILQTLRKGYILAMLIDQNIRAENVIVPFFGIPAPTPVGAARLAVRSGAWAVAGFIERGSDGIQTVRFEEPIPTSRDTDPVELTAAMTAAIERQVRRAPEQWVWMHRRWKKTGARG
ncbi:MAG: lysophospholipid acyltransferase family protein [Thermoanaerobaculia bacterium]